MMFGPTAGDKVRLADTNLIIEVEKDYTVYGDEVKFGGGKTHTRRHGPVGAHHKRRRRLGPRDYKRARARLYGDI